MSVKENTNNKEKREEERKKKNTDTAQTKLDTPHVRYNVKILPQKLIIRDKKISEKHFEKKLPGVVSRF